MIEDSLIWESSDYRLKMQGPTNRDLFNLSDSLAEELLELPETFLVSSAADSDQNVVADLQDIATIECAGVLNGEHSAA